MSTLIESHSGFSITLILCQRMCLFKNDVSCLSLILFHDGAEKLVMCIKLNRSVCVGHTGDHQPIGVDCEHLAAQIEEDIL